LSAFGENAFPGQTLRQVLNNGSGSLDALGRHAVAALLNATNPDVDYPYTEAQVISMFQSVYPGSRTGYEVLKNIFAVANERSCDVKTTPRGAVAGDSQVPGAFPNTGGRTATAAGSSFLVTLIAISAAFVLARFLLRRRA
jgi:hypothetical protein